MPRDNLSDRARGSTVSSI